MKVYVQFSDDTKTVIVQAFGSPQDPVYWPNIFEIEDDDQRYIAFINPGASTAAMAGAARIERERLLRSIYDPGILMAQRALRMAATPEEINYAESKIAELDVYAETLVAIPDQPGFPQTITWPVAPTK